MITKKIKELFTKPVSWKAKYEEKCSECDSWEFKYNKLLRQIEAVVRENK